MSRVGNLVRSPKFKWYMGLTLFLLLVGSFTALYWLARFYTVEDFNANPGLNLRPLGSLVKWSATPTTPTADFPVVLYTLPNYQGESFALAPGMTKAIELFPVDMTALARTKRRLYKLSDGSLRQEKILRSARILPGATLTVVNMIGGDRRQELRADAAQLTTPIAFNLMHFTRRGQLRADHVFVSYVPPPPPPPPPVYRPLPVTQPKLLSKDPASASCVLGKDYGAFNHFIVYTKNGCKGTFQHAGAVRECGTTDPNQNMMCTFN